MITFYILTWIIQSIIEPLLDIFQIHRTVFHNYKLIIFSFTSLLTASFPGVIGVGSVAHPGEEVGVIGADRAENVVFKVEDAVAGTEG
jgi:hypothetical protein